MPQSAELAPPANKARFNVLSRDRFKVLCTSAILFPEGTDLSINPTLEATMRYYHTAFFWATLGVITAGGPAFAQSIPGVLGTYNLSTGQFQPAPVQMLDPSSESSKTPLAVVSRTGTFVFRINITVESPSPSTTMPNCYVNVYHYTSGRSYSENNSITGTRTGDTATCIIRVPYKWTHADSAVQVQMSVTVYLGNRSSGQGLSIPLPANGATTTRPVPITL